MELETKRFLLLLVLSASFHAGVASTLKEATPSQSHFDCDDGHNCINSGGEDLNIRKNVEDIIRDLLQNELPQGLETTNEAEFDINNQIVQETADKIMSQLSLYTGKIVEKILKDSALREKNILEAIEKINSRQTVLENNSQNRITAQFQTIENSTIEEINELKDKITLLTNNTNQLTDAISSSNKDEQESIAIINNRLLELKNASKLEKNDIQNLLNITENIQASLVSSAKEIEVILKNVTEQTKKQTNDTDNSIVRTFCNFNEQKSVKIVRSPWNEKPKQIPTKDELDRFMETSTGCRYKALAYDRDFHLPSESFDGTLFEWRLAVRTRDAADLGITWPDSGYSFFIGEEMSTSTRFRQWSPEEMWKRTTLGVVSADRYVPFYIRIRNGILTAGNECESEPYFTRDVTIKQGDDVNMLFKSWSEFGAKYLYNCPPNSTGKQKPNSDNDT